MMDNLKEAAGISTQKSCGTVLLYAYICVYQYSMP
jgi:hypothetical protein